MTNPLPVLNVFKLNEYATMPTYGTSESACFDLYACIPPGTEVKTRSTRNVPGTTSSNVVGAIVLQPGDRALIPTGLVFDIPLDYSVRLHPRSGNSFNGGFSLANAEGVIDSDYVLEIFAAVYNFSDSPITITHKDRIAQGEMIQNLKYDIYTITERPVRTTRAGGFGSTGG